MKSIVLIASILTLTGMQAISQPVSDPINPDAKIAVIDNQPLYLHELLSSFMRNHSGESVDHDELLDFLPSYFNYRLKLHEAKKLGLDNDPDILDEFETYAREAAYSYWIENKVKQQIIDQFKERAGFELKAFHLLQELAPDASPRDTLAVYNQMLEARDRWLAGDDANDLNNEFSTVRNGNPIGGALPWITAGRTVQEFEDGLYNLEEGEISMPVRSQFGYHVIRLEEKRERTQDRLVSHLFFQPANDDSVYQRAVDAKKALDDGISWNEVVQEYSMDRASAARNGRIGWVGYAMQFPEPFVDEVMQADPKASYSEIISMPYGYQIIRVDSVRTFESDEQFEEHILSQIEQLNRLSPERNDVYETLGNQYGLTINIELIKPFRESGDRYSIAADEDIVAETLITFRQNEYTISNLLEFVEVKGDNGIVFNQFDLDAFKQWVIRNDLVELTREQFPEYNRDMTDFLNGLIVFRINEEFIWNPDVLDEQDLKSYYREHIESYWYDRKFTYYRFSSVDDSSMAQAFQMAESGISPDEIADQFEEVRVRKDSTRNANATSYPLLEQLEPGNVSGIESSGSLKYFYLLTAIEEPRRMTFEEAFTRVASDYQPVREDDYLDYLQNKFDAAMYPENI